MNEQELRAMVRESIARHRADQTRPVRAAADTTYVAHASFVRLPLTNGGEEDGACLIEPTVGCNHCGYCQSYGH